MIMWLFRRFLHSRFITSMAIPSQRHHSTPLLVSRHHRMHSSYRHHRRGGGGRSYYWSSSISLILASTAAPLLLLLFCHNDYSSCLCHAATVDGPTNTTTRRTTTTTTRQQQQQQQHVLRLYFVRHGESVANQWGILAGQQDVPMTDTGLLQAHVLGNNAPWLQAPMWKLYCSDLIRAQTTARYMLQAAQRNDWLSRLTLEPRLRERSYGPRQGLSKDLTEEEAISIWESHNIPPPIYETDVDLWNRTMEWLQQDIVPELQQFRTLKETTSQQHLEEYITSTNDNGNDNDNDSVTTYTYPIMVTSHAGIIRTVLLQLFSMDELRQHDAKFDVSRNNRLIIPNTSVTIVEFTLPNDDSDSDNEDETLFWETAKLVQLTNADHLDQVDLYGD